MDPEHREKLEQIENLLALNLIQDKDGSASVRLLYRAGYNSKRISEYIGMNPSTVRNHIADFKEREDTE